MLPTKDILILIGSILGILAATLLYCMYAVNIKKDGWKKRYTFALLAYAMFLVEPALAIVSIFM